MLESSIAPPEPSLACCWIAYAIPFGFPSTGWNWVGWIGIVSLVTAVIGYCPAYSLFGFSSCSASAYSGEREALAQH